MNEATTTISHIPATDSYRDWPVIEIFGPTIQGEGPQAGLACQFIRFGGCDYRCSWCDSMYAVDPAEVRANSERMTSNAIVNKLLPEPRWVVLSGGNPALFDLSELVTHMQEDGYFVAVETQGSRWKDWLGQVDQLVISPKPPSSGMVSIRHTEELIDFMEKAEDVWSKGSEVATKIVVFNEDDYEWAKSFLINYPWGQQFLSVGTDQLEPDPGIQPAAHDRKVQDLLLDRYRWLCDKVKMDGELQKVRVLPQLHVLAWGTMRGV